MEKPPVSAQARRRERVREWRRELEDAVYEVHYCSAVYSHYASDFRWGLPTAGESQGLCRGVHPVREWIEVIVLLDSKAQQ